MDSGVPETRLDTIGHGESEPVAQNDTGRRDGSETDASNSSTWEHSRSHALLTRLAPILFALLFAPLWAQAESEKLVGMTLRAAELCKSGGDAQTALSELLAAVESEYGTAHDAAELIRLYAGLRAGAATSGEGSSDRAIDPALGRALKKLRACTPAPASEREVLTEITLRAAPVRRAASSTNAHSIARLSKQRELARQSSPMRPTRRPPIG